MEMLADFFIYGASTKGRPTVIYKNFELVKLRENKMEICIGLKITSVKLI